MAKKIRIVYDAIILAIAAIVIVAWVMALSGCISGDLVLYKTYTATEENDNVDNHKEAGRVQDVPGDDSAGDPWYFLKGRVD